MDTRFVTDLELAARFRVSRTTIWRWAAAGKLPRPVRLGGRTTRWAADEVDAAIAKWMADRDAL